MKLLDWLLRPRGNPAPERFEQIDLEKLRYNFAARTNDYRWLAGATSDRKFACWVGSLDYQGQTRESCLRELVDHYQSGDEHWILRRLNDWVPDVRQCANQWLAAQISNLPYNIVLGNQDVLLYVLRSSHTDATAISVIGAELLRHAESQTAALFYCQCAPLRQWLYCRFPNSFTLRGYLLRDPASSNHRLIFRQDLFGTIRAEEQQELQRHRSSVVRTALLRWRVAQGQMPAEGELRELAKDRSRRLSRLAKQLLHNLFDLDIVITRAGG